MLDYEKLDVYRTALEFVITRARGSVMECGALFDLLNALSYVSPDEYRAGKRLLTRIAAMLSKLCLQSA
jgi:hypothetical protein